MIQTVHEPETLPEALALLRDLGDEARPLAGGQSLLVLLRHGLLDLRALVALWRIPELRGIDRRDDGIRLGATVTQREVEGAALLAGDHQALREAAAAVANQQVRNKGTLAGNLCHADPSADPPAALIALGAEVQIASAGETRAVAAGDFFSDFLTVALRPDELVTAIRLPPAAPGAGSAYVKHSLRGVDAAIVGVAVWLRLGPDGSCADARVGLAGAALTPLRARRAERALLGSRLDDAALRAAAAEAADECSPLDDLEASAWYRRRMVQVYVERVGRLAAERAAGG